MACKWGLETSLTGMIPQDLQTNSWNLKIYSLGKGDTSTAKQQFLGFQSLVDLGVESVKIFDILNIQYFTIW